VGVIGEGERDWVTGAAMLMRKECFDRLKGFDESYFMYFEDVDLCYRARRLGYGIGYLPECPIIHLGGMSYASGESHIQREYRKSQLRYYDKFQTLPQRIMIRAYLLLKASVMLISGSDARTSADNIGQIFKSHGN
jgi:N-acetylglucosaminyl-diphospho-decaprenol L-rhamnosyltransferase